MKTDPGRCRPSLTNPAAPTTSPLAVVVGGLALLTSLCAGAQTVSGVGARDCRAFSAALELDSELALDSYVAWSQGYISAFNWTNPRASNIRIDAAALLNWLGPWCAANPQHGVYTAVQELIRLNAR